MISGAVHLPAPNAGVPVSSASIRILTGVRAGEVYTTDARGAFSLPAAETDVALLFFKDHFDDTPVDVRGLTDDRQLDVEMMSRPVRETWSGTINSRREVVQIFQLLEGWPGNRSVETHVAGDLSLHLEADCSVGGTYTDFGFWVENEVTPLLTLLQVWSGNYQPPAGTTLRYQWNDRRTLPAGHYFLVGQLSGYLGGLCAWTMTFEHPY